MEFSDSGQSPAPETSPLGLIPCSPRLPSSRFCSGCGRTLGQLRRLSTVGCGICYEAFRDVLRTGILELQGASEHGQARSVGIPPERGSAPELPRGAQWLESLFGLSQLRWLSESGPHSDVIISSRLRLARNLSRHTFPGAASTETLQAVREETVAAARDRLPQWLVVGLADLRQGEAALLRERHLLAGETRPESELIALRGAELSILVNEEDHLRLQTLSSGLSLTPSLAPLLGVANELETVLDFATSPQLGYLTVCPSNLGSGLRASVLVHLPALAWFEALPEVARMVASVGELTIRGLHGEESSLTGTFLQLSNQVTLGRPEDELVRKVESVAGSLIEWERRARASLLESRRPEIEDAVWRAWGALGHARLMSPEEAVDALSLVRLGALLGLLPERGAVRYLVASGDAHLEWRASSTLSARQADSVRAAILREAFS